MYYTITTANIINNKHGKTVKSTNVLSNCKFQFIFIPIQLFVFLSLIVSLNDQTSTFWYVIIQFRVKFQRLMIVKWTRQAFFKWQLRQLQFYRFIYKRTNEINTYLQYHFHIHSRSHPILIHLSLIKNRILTKLWKKWY